MESEEDYLGDELSDEYQRGLEGDQNALSVQQQEQTTTTSTTGDGSQAVDNWNEEADLKYKTLVLIASTKMKLSKMFEIPKGSESDPSQWRLKNDGRIIFSLENEGLQIEKGDRADFESVLKSLKEQQDNSNLSTKGKAPQTDLVKSIHATYTTSNYLDQLILECNSIPNFKQTITRNNSSFHNMTFMPHTLSATKPRNFEILNRPITNGTMSFQKRFPGANHSNIEDTISPIKSTKNVLVPHNGLLHGFHNVDLPEEKKIKTPYIDGEHPLVMLTKVDAYAALEKAKEKLGNSVLGAITSPTLKFSIFAPPPSRTRSLQDTEFKSSKGKKGVQWRSFADMTHIMPYASEAERLDHLLKHELQFHTKFVIKYLNEEAA